MRKIYQSPQTEAISICVVNTLCASNEPTTPGFGSGSASGAGL